MLIIKKLHIILALKKVENGIIYNRNAGAIYIFKKPKFLLYKVLYQQY